MRLTFLAIILFFFLLIPFIAQAETPQGAICVNQPEIEVRSPDSTTHERICQAAAKALTFLGQYGLHPQRQIRVHVIDTPLNYQGYHAYATYNGQMDKIEIMSHESILRVFDKPIMYDEHFDLVHYDGAVAHEIAHAVFHHNSTNISPGTASQEYLAHAVQLGVLPPEKREGIISRMNVSAWLSGDAISDVYMALEPGKFAVKSYKHLTSSAEPQDFIEILLTSKWFYVYVP